MVRADVRDGARGGAGGAAGGAVLFDFDGTLFDASEAIVHAFNAALRSRGIEAWPRERVLPLIGRPLVEMFPRAAPSASSGEIKDMVRVYREVFLPVCVSLTRPLPGLVPCLRALAAEGFRLAIVTNRKEDGARRILEGFDLCDAFDTVIGIDDVARTKPDPEPVRLALARLGVAARDAVLVGDTPQDMQAAAAAGVRAIGVLTGPFPAEPLRAAGAAAVLPDLTGLPEQVRRVLGRKPCPGATSLPASSASTAGNEAASLPGFDEEEEADVMEEVDVLVIGGGTAGTVAAIQSARAGARTMVLERGPNLGGTMTTGGVAFPGLFDAWGRQIIAGIGWDLVRESVELDGGTLPDFSKVPERHWMNQVKVNPFLYALLAEEKCREAGVAIAYYEFPTRIVRHAGGWQVDCAGFGTRRRVLCRQVVDCTGGAEVVGLLNLPRLREPETQPGSLLFCLGRPCEAGRVGTIDALYVHGADSTNSRTATAANLEGRKDLLARVRASGKRLMHAQPEASFRESYRIVGETVVTVDDYTSGRVFEDAVCYAFYPVDLHTKDGVKPQPLARGTVPTVPLGALVPKGSRDILVAGRCVSSDRRANSGLRVQASCMAMGQAAGAAAALAVAANTTPLHVGLCELRAMLRQHGAIVPGAGQDTRGKS